MDMATPGHRHNPTEPPYPLRRPNRLFVTPSHAIVKGFVCLILLQNPDLLMPWASRSRVHHKVHLHFRQSSILRRIGIRPFILQISCCHLSVNLAISLPEIILSQGIAPQDGNAKEYRAMAKYLTSCDPIPHFPSSISTIYQFQRHKTL